MCAPGFEGSPSTMTCASDAQHDGAVTGIPSCIPYTCRHKTTEDWAALSCDINGFTSASYSYSYDSDFPACLDDCSDCVQAGDYYCMDDCSAEDLAFTAQYGCQGCEADGFDMSNVSVCAGDTTQRRLAPSNTQN